MSTTPMTTRTLEQQLRTSTVVHLGGQSHTCPVINIGPFTPCRTIADGAIKTSPMSPALPRYGAIQLVRNQVWTGINFPAGPLSLILDRVAIGAMSDVPMTHDHSLNDQRLRTAGYYCSGVQDMNECGADQFVMIGGSVSSLHAGLNLHQVHSAHVVGAHFRHIAGSCHVASWSLDNPARLHRLRKVFGFRVGSAFNFSAPANFAYVRPTDGIHPRAIIDGCEYRNLTGRTKVHGPWDVEIRNSRFEQLETIPSPYYGLAFPAGRKIEMDNVTITGFLAGGIQAEVPAGSPVPELRIRNALIMGGQIAFNITPPIKYHLENVRIEGCYTPWSPANPPATQTNVTITTPRDARSMAMEYVRHRNLLRELNAANGTTHDPDRYFGFIDGPIRAEIARIESGGAPV